jgi:hypothetical protein
MNAGLRAWLMGASVVLGGTVPAQQPGLVGELPLQASWQGSVRLDGDVTVPKGGRLVIAPGTVVTVAARDRSKGGFHPDRVELHVRGQLLIEGTLEQPVVFVPDDGRGTRLGGGAARSWHGIVLHDRQDGIERRTMVRGVQIWRAFAGIQVPAGSALVEECVFAECSEGMQVGAAYKDDRFHGAAAGVADPEVRRCRFVDCGTGIYTESQARLHVEHSAFVGGGTGVGASRPGIHYMQSRPGSRVIGCAFVDVGDAVFGCAVVRESWFLRCRRALRLSNYHDRLATHVEPFVFEANLCEAVEEVVAGDSGAAATVHHGPIRPRGSLAALRTPWPPLPDCLLLAADSVGKGRGQNGRDLGPLTASRVVEDRELPPFAGALLGGWLAAPIDPLPAGKKPQPAQAGGKIGNRWWAAADAAPNGVLHLRRVFGIGRSSGWLALPFVSSGGKVRLPWTGDVAAIEFQLDGKPIPLPARRRRFGADEPAVTIDCAAGKHVLLVRVEGWGADPRLAFGTVDGWQPAEPPAGAAVTMRAVPKRGSKGVQIHVTPSAPVHWAAAPVTELVVLKDAVGGSHAIDWDWTDAGVLRLVPAAQAPRKQELSLVWLGLRDPHGRPLQVEPTVVRLP